MLKFKHSVVIKEETDVLKYIFNTLRKLDLEVDGDIVVTSVNDSKHAVGSAHYRNEAVDIRCNDRPYDVDMFMVARLRQMLGPSFLVLYESKGTSNEHIHIQLRKGFKWTDRPSGNLSS